MVATRCEGYKHVSNWAYSRYECFVINFNRAKNLISVTNVNDNVPISVNFGVVASSSSKQLSSIGTLSLLDISLFDTMLNFVENLLENERDPRSGPMNDQDHSLSLSDPDRSLAVSHFLTNFLQNLASCHTAFRRKIVKATRITIQCSAFV
jgi:hypothetical protein